MKFNTQDGLGVFLVLLLTCLSASGQIRPDVTRPPAPPVAPKTAAPKSAALKTTQIVIQTEPRAQVYLDDIFKGQASSQGRLVLDQPPLGDHALRVSLPGKQDYERKVTVAAGQVIKLTAGLPDLTGTVTVQASPGASVFLDGSSRGMMDATGHLSIHDVAAGAHELRIAAPGKQDFRQNITVSAGQEAKVETPLADLAGTVVVQTSPGAAVFLDDSSRGTVDATGRLSIRDVAAGAHDLRIKALGKSEFRQSITVAGGEEASVDAALVDIGPAPGEDAFWTSIENNCNADDFRNYLKQYPNGAQAAVAKTRLGEIEESAARQSSVLAGRETTVWYGKTKVPVAIGTGGRIPGTCKMREETVDLLLETFQGHEAISFPADRIQFRGGGAPGYPPFADYAQGRIYVTDQIVAFQSDAGKINFDSSRSGTVVKREVDKFGQTFAVEDAKGKRHGFGKIPFDSEFVMFLQKAIADFPGAYKQVQQLPHSGN